MDAKPPRFFLYKLYFIVEKPHISAIISQIPSKINPFEKL